jgi:hypothetical protein
MRIKSKMEKWLCCYCGLQFPKEADCTLHESVEHSKDREVFCYHQNFLESEYCIDCNPYLGINERNFRGFISENCHHFHREVEDLYHCKCCSPSWPYCAICAEYYPFLENKCPHGSNSDKLFKSEHC